MAFPPGVWGRVGESREVLTFGGFPPKAAAAFDLKSGLSVFVHEHYINMMFLQKSLCICFPPLPHPTLYFYVYVLPEFCHGVRVCHGVLSMRNL